MLGSCRERGAVVSTDATQLDWLGLSIAKAARKRGTKGLLTDTPRSRRDDPETSHAAADWVRRTGVLNGHQRAVLDTVRSHPGSTYLEIAQHSGIERHAVARRLKELEPMHIRRGEIRRDGPRPLLSWWPVERSA